MNKKTPDVNELYTALSQPDALLAGHREPG